MKYSEVLAKSEPKKTLIEHTKDCLYWFPKVMVWNDIFIDKISERYSISKLLIKERLYLTVSLHDIGKATEKFQIKVRGVEPKPLESHALSSVPILFDLIHNKPIFSFEDTPYYPEILAVASHHSKLKKNLFESCCNMVSEYASEEYFIEFFQFANNQAKKLNIEGWEDIKFNRKCLVNRPFNLFQDEVFLNLEEDSFRYERSNVIRDLFLLFKSTLHYCDWLASSGNTNYEYSTTATFSSITEKMKEKVSSFQGWQPFQLKSAKHSSQNIFVQIPTGQGKTEASVLWAVENNENQKILFLLPTMVTTNKMWERMRFFFGGDECVGLSHGTAQYVIKEKDETIESQSLRQHFLYNRTFFKPVTVATIDQLIYSFFNWGYWVLTNAASNNAKIIIDEIHIYDAYTFGLLLEIIKCITPYHSRFAIMSASLPNILKEELKEVLPDYEIINDKIFNQKQRHLTSVLDIPIESCIPDIVQHYFLNYKVLVVCNTIKKAREIFDACMKQEIDQERVMLYHSQFILCDKIEKEHFLEDIATMNGGYIAICTQIVEVSLDIDFDVLYTENAPIDAVIQRLGRVNRKGRIQKRIPDLPFAPVFITRESENSRKYVYKDLQKVLENTFIQLKSITESRQGNVIESDFKNIVEAVYTIGNLGENYFKTLNEGRVLIKTLWNGRSY